MHKGSHIVGERHRQLLVVRFLCISGFDEIFIGTQSERLKSSRNFERKSCAPPYGLVGRCSAIFVPARSLINASPALV